jgi:hypothetical protein
VHSVQIRSFTLKIETELLDILRLLGQSSVIRSLVPVAGLRSDNGYRFRRRLRKVSSRYADKELSLAEAGASIVSWIGHAGHAETHGLCSAILGQVSFQAGHGGARARRVNRGGSWNNNPSYLRVSDRYWSGISDRNNFLGFRLAQDL